MADIVTRILRGDPQAVVVFYKQYAPGMLRYLEHKLPQTEDAQDILNEVFLDAVDGLPALSTEANLKAWLYAIAHNKVANFYRKRKIKSVLFSQFPYLKIISAEIHQPEFQLEKRELKIRLQMTLEKLSLKYRQILTMHYIEDMPIKVISVELDLSFKATESLLYRARQQFIKDYEGI